MSSRHVCSWFDRLSAKCPLTCIMAMNHEKGGRHNPFLDKWLKEFGLLQTRSSGDDLLMICKDCTKAGKKNAFTSGCKNFQRSVLVHHMNQVDHKNSAKVLLQQQHFKAACDNASKGSDDSLVKQMQTAYSQYCIDNSCVQCFMHVRGVFSCQTRIKTGLRNRQCQSKTRESDERCN